MMIILLAILGTAASTVSGRYIQIRRSTCDNQYYLDSSESIEFTYSGYNGMPSSCNIKISVNDISDDVCVKMIDTGSPCILDIEYHSGSSTYFPDRSLDCSSDNLYEEYCTIMDTLTVAIKNPSLNVRSTPLKFKVYSKSNTFVGDVEGLVKTSVYIVIGIIVGCVVLLIITVVVVILCCCRRRQASAGYQTPQRAAASTTTQAIYQPQPVMGTQYPQQNVPQQQPYQPLIAGYQPPPGGYQPPPAGYQPPPAGPKPSPAGYQPPQAGSQLHPYPQPAGYPPAPQQGYAGYQTAPPPESAPTPEKPTIASAPPLQEMYPMQKMDPPPYPGY